MHIEVMQRFGDDSVTLSCDTDDPEVVVLCVSNSVGDGQKKEAAIAITGLELWKLEEMIQKLRQING